MPDHRRSRSPARHHNRRSRSPERGSRRRSRSPERGSRRRERSRSRSPERGSRRRERSRSRERRPPPPPSRLPDAPHGYPPPAQPPPPPAAPPALHSVHKGRVHTIRPFGLFIEVPGVGRHILVHNSQISDEVRFAKEDADEDKVKAMEFYCPKGQEVWVKVCEVTPDERSGGVRIGGSMRVVDQSTGVDLDPTNLKLADAGARGPLSDGVPEEGTVHRAVVKRVEPYGVFVALQGFRKFGLVHSSHVSNYLSFTKDDNDEDKKAELASVAGVGESVWAKVVEVIPDDGTGRGPKIQCSLKLVDQTTGEDLDPTNMRYQPRGSEGMLPGGGGSAPIGAAAGAVRADGRIDWGHLAGNNKLIPGDHTGQYKLLEDDTGGRRPLPGPPVPLPPPPLPPPPPPPAKITSVEEALAVLEQASRREKEKKKSKKKSKEKHKKAKKSKDEPGRSASKKKHKKSSGRAPSSSSTSS